MTFVDASVTDESHDSLGEHESIRVKAPLPIDAHRVNRPMGFTMERSKASFQARVFVGGILGCSRKVVIKWLVNGLSPTHKQGVYIYILGL